jgi:phage/plasmid-like protein (TIGR03299 family)
MAHNLTQREDGKYEYMFAGAPPWHGLGQNVEGSATAEEAIRKANLGWSVSKRQMMTLDGIDCPDFFAIVRDDNNKPLGQVGRQYKPTQINEAFAFFDAVVGTAKAKYISAGSIGGGGRIFIVAEMEGLIQIKGNDTVRRYLTFCHGHDGTLAHRLFPTGIRVVCQNTLDAALAREKAAKEGFYSRHTGDLQYRIDEAASILGFANRSFELFGEQAKLLAGVVVNVQQVEKFLRTVFEIPVKAEEASKQTQEAVDKVLDNFENHAFNQAPEIKGTAWALLNSVTQFADHQARSAGDGAERRFKSIMFGGGNSLKATAWKSAMALVK